MSKKLKPLTIFLSDDELVNFKSHFDEFLNMNCDDKIKEQQEEIERLNNIINETRRILGEYKHFSTPTEEQNSENEEIVDKAYIKLHSNLQELKGDKNNDNK